jgi:hypothetical protein
MTAARAMRPRHLPTIIQGSAPNAIQRIIGVRMDLTTTGKMIAARAMHPRHQPTIIQGSARSAIPRITGPQMDLTTTAKMTAFPAINKMLREDIIRVNARTATAQVMDGQMPILATQDLMIVYHAIQVTNLAVITPVNVPTAIQLEAPGATRISTTVV